MTRPYIFKNDRAEFPHGYLEWKPEAEIPTAKTQTEKLLEDWKYDNFLIQESRVAVSPEWKDWVIDRKTVHYNVGRAVPILEKSDYYFLEGSDFTIRDGKAYQVEPVCKECHNLYGVIDECACSMDEKIIPRLRAENEKLQGLVKKLEEEIAEIKEARGITRKDIERLQNDVYQITGRGEVMALFNKLLGNSAA